MQKIIDIKKTKIYKIMSYIWHLPAVQIFVPSKVYLKIQYKNFMGKSLNLSDPKTFNEKIQWLKIYDRNPLYTQLADKYAVRKYIERVLGKEYLIPLLGVYDNFDEIDFNALPDQFVLKPTHTSGDILICKDKSKIDLLEIKNEVKRWLKRNYYWVHREWPYKNIKPRIICEKYMVDESGKQIKDYKIMCFNGKAKCVFVCSNRNSPGGLNIDIYDMDWNLMPVQRPNSPNSGVIIPTPKTFEMMVKFAEKLSKDIPFVRVDFYEVNGQLYFGEMTFYPASGFEKFEPESYDYLFGSWLQLPINN